MNEIRQKQVEPKKEAAAPDAKAAPVAKAAKKWKMIKNIVIVK